MYKENNGSAIITSAAALPLESIGLITWIVFMILYYGCKPSPIAHWDVFWVWFPLWAPCALTAALILLVFIIVGIICLVSFIKDRR